jgi:hypothetical protein
MPEVVIHHMALEVTEEHGHHLYPVIMGRMEEMGIMVVLEEIPLLARCLLPGAEVEAVVAMAVKGEEPQRIAEVHLQRWEEQQESLGHQEVPIMEQHMIIYHSNTTPSKAEEILVIVDRGVTQLQMVAMG